MTNSVSEAKNLAAMICESVSGLVKRSSNVPRCFSSAKVLIVIAGIRKRNKNLEVPKSPCKLATLENRILLMLGNTHRNNPAMIKKTPIKI
jgi:hypothetical protein